jgi:hypothetical protein
VEHVEAAYPVGPFGDAVGSVIRNYKFRGFARPQDGDFSGQTIQMADFYNPTGAEMHAAESMYGAKPKPKAVLIVIAAGWCEPCKHEAREILPGEYAQFAPQGAEFLTIMAEDPSSNQPDLVDLSKWTNAYDSLWPSVVDGQFKFFALAEEPAFPANILVETKTMTIVDRVAGADPAIFSKMEQILTQ